MIMPTALETALYTRIQQFEDRLHVEQQKLAAQFPHLTTLGLSTMEMAKRLEWSQTLNAASLIDADTYIALRERLPFLLMEQEAQESRISAQAVGLTALCFSTY